MMELGQAYWSMLQVIVRRRALLAVIVIAAALVLHVSSARAERINADLEATLLVKILGFQRNAPKRSGSQAVIAVVSDGDERNGEMVRAFNYLGLKKGARLDGKTVTAIAVSSSELEDKGKSATAIYVAATTEIAQSRAALVGAKLKIPTMTSSREALRRGLTIAVVEKDSRPSILINAPAAKRAGLSFDPRLLRLAEVVK